MRVRVLADYHHHDLFESLELLFEDRLGWELYRPIGLEWFEQGYWNFERAWHGDAVAKQYLTPYDNDAHGFFREGLDLTERVDRSHGRLQRLLTLEQARTYKPDIVIASVAHNHEGLHRFAREVGAKFGLHIGNVRFSRIDMREDRWDLADFGIVTTKLPETPPKPHVVVHQEFSLADFRYEPPTGHDPFVVSSFVNCFAENAGAYADFRHIAQEHPEIDWRVYGAYGSVPEDEYACGNINVCADVAKAMRASDVAYHTKHWSDGFGHVIHNWFAVGRPVMGYAAYYASQLAGPLWQEGVTSFDIGNLSRDEIAGLIKGLQVDPDRHRVMCEAAAKRFREVVNYDEEEQAIRRMFEAVL